MRLVGDYNYRTAVIDGIRYALCYNGDELRRIRQVDPHADESVWEDGLPFTAKAFNIIAQGKR